MISIATNNADIGGGEVMLVQLAKAITAVGRDTQVLAPAGSEVAEAARATGLPVVALAAGGRREWMMALRRWDRRERRGVLWCNGLVPALATSGHPNRVVHLHRLPSSGAQRVAARIARIRSRATVVPSQFMAQSLGAEVLPNWSRKVDVVPAARTDDRLRIGFLGRLSPDKGIVELCEALYRLSTRRGSQVELVVAGEARFVSREDERRITEALAGLGPSYDPLGWVPPGELLGQVDLLAVPSQWEEPFGLVVTEAMSVGVPVVVSDAGALPEVVGPGHPWVAKRGDVGDLARVLADAAVSPERRGEVGEAGRRRWAERYSPEAGQKRLADFLDRHNL